MYKSLYIELLSFVDPPLDSPGLFHGSIFSLFHWPYVTYVKQGKRLSECIGAILDFIEVK